MTDPHSNKPQPPASPAGESASAVNHEQAKAIGEKPETLSFVLDFADPSAELSSPSEQMSEASSPTAGAQHEPTISQQSAESAVPELIFDYGKSAHSELTSELTSDTTALSPTEPAAAESFDSLSAMIAQAPVNPDPRSTDAQNFFLKHLPELGDGVIAELIPRVLHSDLAASLRYPLLKAASQLQGWGPSQLPSQLADTANPADRDTLSRILTQDARWEAQPFIRRDEQLALIRKMNSGIFLQGADHRSIFSAFRHVVQQYPDWLELRTSATAISNWQKASDEDARRFAEQQAEWDADMANQTDGDSDWSDQTAEPRVVWTPAQLGLAGMACLVIAIAAGWGFFQTQQHGQLETQLIQANAETRIASQRLSGDVETDSDTHEGASGDPTLTTAPTGTLNPVNSVTSVATSADNSLVISLQRELMQSRLRERQVLESLLSTIDQIQLQQTQNQQAAASMTMNP